MGFKKETPVASAPAAAAPASTPAPAPAAAPAVADSGAAAAVERLKKSAAPAAAPKNAGSRDYNEEARGKTRCTLIAAALMSPAIAGMKHDSMPEYLAFCREAADFGTAYTFGELPPAKK